MKGQDKLIGIAQAYARLFETEEGKKVLAHLDSSFCNKRLIGTRSADQIIASAAQHDTVRFIHEMVAMGNMPPIKPKGN